MPCLRRDHAATGHVAASQHHRQCAGQPDMGGSRSRMSARSLQLVQSIRRGRRSVMLPETRGNSRIRLGAQWVVAALLFAFVAVAVAGEVRQRNLYHLPEGTTFAQAIARAGGPTELGRLDEVHVIRRDRTMVINLAQEYSRYEGVPVASGDQVLVARRSNFNFLRDFLYPVASLTAAVAAVLAYSRYR